MKNVTFESNDFFLLTDTFIYRRPFSVALTR